MEICKEADPVSYALRKSLTLWEGISSVTRFAMLHDKTTDKYGKQLLHEFVCLLQ